MWKFFASDKYSAEILFHKRQGRGRTGLVHLSMDSTLLLWAGGITTQYSSRVINSTGAQISVGASITQGSPFSFGATFHSSLWPSSVLHTASISHITLETRANSARIHCLSFCDFPSGGKSLSQQQLLLLLHFLAVPTIFLLLWKHCFYVLLNHTKRGIINCLQHMSSYTQRSSGILQGTTLSAMFPYMSRQCLMSFDWHTCVMAQMHLGAFSRLHCLLA